MYGKQTMYICRRRWQVELMSEKRFVACDKWADSEGNIFKFVVIDIKKLGELFDITNEIVGEWISDSGINGYVYSELEKKFGDLNDK